MPYIRWFETLSNDDVGLVGGKNASLGEMTQSLASAGIRVPPGFATTTAAYDALLDGAGLREPMTEAIQAMDDGRQTLRETASFIRDRILQAPLPDNVDAEIRAAYRELSARTASTDPVAVAVRSSATAEDLPTASFAGQQESFLNVRGEEAVVDACRRCIASLFTDRAVAYREAHGFAHMDVALSVGVQQMVRSDEGAAGTLFTIDTETGFPDVVLIHASWGLGEAVVKGQVTPDQYVVYKPFADREGGPPILEKSCGEKRVKIVYADAEEPVSGDASPTREVETTPEERAAFAMTDADIQQLTRWAIAIEEHYGRPMDVEWAKDGGTGELFVVQARPETIHGTEEGAVLRTYRLLETGAELVTGQDVGEGIAAGAVHVIRSVDDLEAFPADAILVAPVTDPDWVPAMRRAAGIVTDHGGRTSHAAIVSRELGIPAVVGTGNATEVLSTGREVTVSCAGDTRGVVYDGRLEIETTDVDLSNPPDTVASVMMNIASPAAARRWWRLPAAGIGLARMEYLINNVIQVHPLALTRYDQIQDEEVRARIDMLAARHESREAYFVETLGRGIAMIAATQYPRPVVVRLSDFKTNEYARLVGGEGFEPKEENPMLGWRGAARYYSEGYRDGFALECRALRFAREDLGFDNVIAMIPFCRTPEEGDRVLEEMAEHGLRRGEAGLEVYVMAEIPSNITLADAFAERFDGFSIGSNDLTQLMLGVDRDSEQLAYLFDERHAAVTRPIRLLIETAHQAGRPVGICGQGPSDYPEFAALLIEAGIDSISVLPDSLMRTLDVVATAESALKAGRPVAAHQP